MNDKWEEVVIAGDCKWIADAPDSAHTNGVLPQLEIGPYRESESEEERLMDHLDVVEKAHAFKSTVNGMHVDSQKCWNFKGFRCRIWRSIAVVMFESKINLLFPFGPAASILASRNMQHGWVFLFSLLGLTPLAERLGFLTEQIAFYTGPTGAFHFNFCLLVCLLFDVGQGKLQGDGSMVEIQGTSSSHSGSGNSDRLLFSSSPQKTTTSLSDIIEVLEKFGGLLNATFGNATEMIISIYALKSGMTRVVQQSLLGSILSNMLLVLGCSFLTGGVIHHKKNQVFNKAAAAVNSGLLLMAVMGLLFPAVLHFTHTELHSGKSELALSRFSSCIMLVAYAFYLVFQLKSHKDLYECNNEVEINNEGDSEEEASPQLAFCEAILWLTILTGFISILSGYLVNAIQGTSESWNMPVAFISVILLPTVGNAAEHASAVMFAVKDKLDISLGVAIGSSIQISMFLIPFCVVVGWIMGKHMDLNFEIFETATLFITVLVVAFMLQDGTSNYFKGLMLILCYLIVAASFFVHIDHKNDGED